MIGRVSDSARVGYRRRRGFLDRRDIKARDDLLELFALRRVIHQPNDPFEIGRQPSDLLQWTDWDALAAPSQYGL